MTCAPDTRGLVYTTSAFQNRTIDSRSLILLDPPKITQIDDIVTNFG
jgi:hypothetical protein